MSAAVCRGAAVMPTFDAVPNCRRRPAQLDVWNTAAQPADKQEMEHPAPNNHKPYVHPLVCRRSTSHKSLQVCTETLGCETGSGDFLSVLDDTTGMPWLCAPSPVEAEEAVILPPASEPDDDDKELTAVHCHCSRPQRAFPPPLPSMCLQMSSHRRDGRLVVEAVPVRPHGYLHAQRQGDRLRLCFVHCSAREQSTTTSNTVVQEAEQEERAETERPDEEEREVEVVDRGTAVDVTQPS